MPKQKITKEMVVETACGKQTKAEALGFTETAIARLCNYV